MSGGNTEAAEAGRVLYGVGEATVTLEDRGALSVLRFAGTCTPELAQWLPQALKEIRASAALCLRELEAVDLYFVEELLRAGRDAARRKRQVVLVDPPAFVVGVLEESGMADRLPVLSCEAALLEGRSVPDALLREQAALSDAASRIGENPLWRRLDHESAWLCPICGSNVDDVRVESVLKPAPAMLRGVRRHLLERCAAWRAGRRAPLPATILDSFLLEINRRKSASDAERRERSARERESLQEKAESMQDLEQSLGEAKRRQLHMIPIDPAPDAVADIAVIYRPLQSVSGDFLDFYPLADGRFGVAVGDVSGHGIETAVIMGMAKMAFRVRAQALGAPRDMMILANADLFHELRRAAFVTGFFALIDRATRRMAYVRAGHTPALLRRAGGGIEVLEGAGLPFGVDDGRRFAVGLEEREVQLAAGDILLLYTDGVTEAGTADPFGDERLRQALESAPSGAPARDVLAHVTASLDGFLSGAPLSDDVTLVCLVIK